MNSLCWRGDIAGKQISSPQLTWIITKLYCTRRYCSAYQIQTANVSLTTNFSFPRDSLVSNPTQASCSQNSKINRLNAALRRNCVCGGLFLLIYLKEKSSTGSEEKRWVQNQTTNEIKFEAILCPFTEQNLCNIRQEFNGCLIICHPLLSPILLCSPTSYWMIRRSRLLKPYPTNNTRK